MAARIIKIRDGMRDTGFLRIASHILFWAAVLLFNYVLFSLNNTNREVTFIISAGLLPLAILVTYFFNYVLIPRFLLQRRYGRFFLFSLYTFLFSSWGSFMIVLFVLIFGVKKYASIEASVMHPELQVVTLHFVIFFAVAVKQVKRTFYIQQEKSRIEKIRLTTELKLKEAELKLLKAQIQPHFLFNTLNNLYGLTLEKSDQAPELVLRLSGILDYILYRCEEKRVPLDEEIQNIQNYLEIEKIRYYEKLKLEFVRPEKTSGLKIAPLILLPFIENAFKHGVSNQPEEAEVSVTIGVKNKVLNFRVFNTIPLVEPDQETKGLGLAHVRKRLELSYPERFKLEINDERETYSVTLNINLEDQDV